MFIFYLTKIFQIFGIFLVGEAMYFGIYKDNMAKEMMLLSIGGAVFFIGWFMQRWSK